MTVSSPRTAVTVNVNLFRSISVSSARAVIVSPMSAGATCRTFTSNPTDVSPSSRQSSTATIAARSIRLIIDGVLNLSTCPATLCSQTRVFLSPVHPGSILALDLCVPLSLRLENAAP